jgi:uncharacterized protein (TIGR02996 family)
MTEADFLRGILDDPDSDTPRLVFTDWLEEQGDDLRANFIRTQIELSHIPYNAAGWKEVFDRQHALRLRYEPRWRKQLPPWTAYLRLQLRRGFGGHASTTIPNFLKHSKKLFQLEPIQHVRLEIHDFSHLERLLSSPYITRLRGLEFGWVQDHVNALRQLADCPGLSGLRHLAIMVPIDAESAHMFVASPHLSSLRTIYPRDNVPERQWNEMKEILEQRFQVTRAPWF